MDWKADNEKFYKKESEMFNLAADYYDRYRPSYPREIIDTLINKSGLNNNSRVLEIGSGSGKATELFTEGGYQITCIDPGKDLVTLGNKKFEAYPNIRFECSRFEEYETVAGSYDLIISAQAFHWIPQPIGFEKCASALKENGFLAPFWNMYITYDTDIDKELLEISYKYLGMADFLDEEGCEKRIASIVSSIEQSGYFTRPEVYRHLWKKSYTADEYYGFALTGNSFLQRSEAEQEQAHKELIKLADRHGGLIERPYLCVLYLAKRL